MQDQNLKSRCSTLGKYLLIKTLGSGYNSKVKLAYEPTINQYFAIKMIKHSHPKISLKNIRTEIDVLSHLRHPNMINLVEFYEDIDYIKKNGDFYKVVAIVLELIPGGELFEYIASSGRFSEEVARTYFRTLIDTIEYCHNQGVVHRDLKAENLLIDGNFNLRVADFGFATLLAGRDGTGQLYTVLGTESYMAPEIHLRQPYSGPSVDLFACAVILFIVVSGNPPFLKADPKSDAHYKLLCINRPDAFWEAHEKNKPKEEGQNFYSKEFKNLMNAMFALDPAVRPSLSEIKAHPWFNGPQKNLKELQAEFIGRKQNVDKLIQRQRAIRREQKLASQAQASILVGGGSYSGMKPFRNVDAAAGEVDDLKMSELKISADSKRQIKQYLGSTGLKASSEIFSSMDPEALLKLLTLACQTSLNEHTISDSSYKIKGKAIGEEGTCTLNILITQVDEGMYCVEFHRLDGNVWVFYKVIDEIKEKLPDVANIEREETTEPAKEQEKK